MKKVLAFLLVLCLIFTAFPLCAWAQTSDIIITTNIERDMYYTEDTFTVSLDLNNCANGFSSLRGKLNYDSENITFNSFKFEIPENTEDEPVLTASYSEHNGYVQILWSAGPGLTNYAQDGIIAELEFTVNKKADNKTYTFDFEYLDGTRYTYGESFKDTDWEYLENVEIIDDSFTVNTDIDSMLYFENAPGGAYTGENVSFDIAFNGEEGLYLFKTKLLYDKNVFDFVSCTDAEDSLNLSFTEKDGYIVLLFDNEETCNFNKDGIIATVTFSVKEDAELCDTSVSLEYVDAVSVNFDNGISVEKTLYNARYWQFPILSQKTPISATFNRGNGVSETVTLYKDEKLVLPDTNFIDKNWYTDAGASFNSVYTETICPGEDLVLYSSACAVDYSGSDFIVPYRYNQQFEIINDGSLELLSYSSKDTSETARMFRLDKLTDNTTYKLSITYKANIDGALGLGIAGATGNNMYVNTSYFEGNQNTSVYNFVSSKEYKTADVYFTASIKGTVDEQSNADDKKFVNGNGWAYLILIDSNENDNDEIFIKDVEITEVENALTVGGASILNEAGFAAAENKQAIRYYFSYQTYELNSGAAILLNGKAYNLKERGFIYRNGAVDKYLDENSVTKEGMNLTSAQNNSEMIIQSKAEGFNACWDYDTDTQKLCFSTYVNNYTEEMYSRKLMVRGFITFIDDEGNEFTIYSSPINRSINGIMESSISNLDVL